MRTSHSMDVGAGSGTGAAMTEVKWKERKVSGRSVNFMLAVCGKEGTVGVCGALRVRYGLLKEC